MDNCIYWYLYMILPVNSMSELINCYIKSRAERITTFPNPDLGVGALLAKIL